MMIANVHKKVWYPHLNLSSSLLLDVDTGPFLKDPENGCRICLEKFDQKPALCWGFTFGSTFFTSHPAENCFPVSTFPYLNTIWKNK